MSFLRSSDGLKSVTYGAFLWVAGVGIVRLAPDLFSSSGFGGFEATTVKMALIATAPASGYLQVLLFKAMGIADDKLVHAAAAGCATALWMDGLAMSMPNAGAYGTRDDAETVGLAAWLLVTFGSVIASALFMVRGGIQRAAFRSSCFNLVS